MSPSLTLVPFEDVTDRELAWLAEDLSARGWQVEAMPALPLPAHAYHHSRGQYEGNMLLQMVCCLPRRWLLGVVGADLYVGEAAEFVFGIAQIPGKCALISLSRLRREEELRRQRAVTEAVHELGHTLGLPHCPDPHCVMHASDTVEDIDRKSSGLCATCRGKLPPNLVF